MLQHNGIQGSMFPLVYGGNPKQPTIINMSLQYGVVSHLLASSETLTTGNHPVQQNKRVNTGRDTN